MTPVDLGRERPTGRTEILNVARRLFMTRGYRAVTTREIADAVGVTQPALYHHFGGKEALYVAVLEEDLQLHANAIEEAVARVSSARERLREVATWFAVQGDQDLGQMFHDLRFEVSEATRLRIGDRFRDAMMRPMLGLIDALVDEGDIVAPRSVGMTKPEVAMYVLSIIRMLNESNHGPARGSPRSPEAIADLTIQLVVGGMGRRAGS